jgi:hypothetical protein
MKITLKKVITSTTVRDPKAPPSSFSTAVKWQFVEQPTVYLCQEIERVLNLQNIPIGTVLELDIGKFCVIPPGGC